MANEARPNVKISISGVDAVLLDVAGSTFSDENQRRLWAIAEHMAALPEVRDSVPGMNNLLVVFDIRQSSHKQIETRLSALWESLEPKSIQGREMTITVRYGEEHGPDLNDLAEHCGMTPAEVVKLHMASTYTVVAVGGMAGFPFLSGLDPRIHCPRRSVPRLSLKQGSVIIGGGQASIMPCTAPGGWNIIGMTDLSLFDPEQAPPNHLRVGDKVRFVEDGK